jgi:hypothetical protein
MRVAAAVRAEERRITIRLDPPDLGRVEVRLDIRDDTVRVAMAVERPETLDLLRRDAQLLDAALQRANVRLEGNLEFSLRQSQSGWAGGWGEGAGGHGRGRQAAPWPDVSADRDIDVPMARSRLAGDGAIDIIV